MNWIIKNFLRGLVIVVPIAITIYVVVEAFLRIDRLLELRTPGLGFALPILVIVSAKPSPGVRSSSRRSIRRKASTTT